LAAGYSHSQARETVKGRSKGSRRTKICKDTSQSKKIVFQANPKLHETTLSRGYISPACLLSSKRKTEKQRKRTGLKTGSGEQSSRPCARQALQTEGRTRNTRWPYQDAGTHTTHWWKRVPGSDVPRRGTGESPPTEDSHCQVTRSDTPHKPAINVQMAPFGISPVLPFTPILLQT